MLDQIRNAIQLASGIAEVPRQQAERFAKDLAKRGELRASQVTGLADQIVKRSQENMQMVQTLVSSEIRRQVKALGLATREDLDRMNRKVFGLATKDDIDRLSKKLSELESRQRSTAATPRVASRPKAQAAGAPASSPKASTPQAGAKRSSSGAARSKPKAAPGRKA